jgi:hypothetical protein
MLNVISKGRRHLQTYSTIFKFLLSKPGRSKTGHNLLKDYVEQCAAPARTEDHDKNLEHVPYFVQNLFHVFSHKKNPYQIALHHTIYQRFSNFQDSANAEPPSNRFLINLIYC